MTNIFHEYPDFFVHKILSFLMVHEIGMIMMTAKTSSLSTSRRQISNLDLTRIMNPDLVTDQTIKTFIRSYTAMDNSSAPMSSLKVLALKSRTLIEIDNILSLVNVKFGIYLHTLVLSGCTGLFQKSSKEELKEQRIRFIFNQIGSTCQCLKNVDLSQCGDPYWGLPISSSSSLSSNVQTLHVQYLLIAGLISLLKSSTSIERLWLRDNYVFTDLNIVRIIQTCRESQLNIKLFDIGFSSQQPLKVGISPVYYSGFTDVIFDEMFPSIEMNTNHELHDGIEGDTYGIEEDMGENIIIRRNPLLSLESLSLRGCCRLSPDHLTDLAYFPNLKHLDLSGLNLNSAQLENITQFHHGLSSSFWCHLVTLSLARSPVDTKGLCKVMANCLKLKSLSLHGCLNIDDFSLIKASSSYSSSSSLCSSSSSTSSFLSNRFQSEVNEIECLNISFTSVKCTSKLLQGLLTRYPNMKKLNVRCCLSDHTRTCQDGGFKNMVDLLNEFVMFKNDEMNKQIQILGKEIPEPEHDHNEEIEEEDIIKLYERNHYEWINWNTLPRNSTIDELCKWDGFIGLSGDTVSTVIKSLHPFVLINYCSNIPSSFYSKNIIHHPCSHNPFRGLTHRTIQQVFLNINEEGIVLPFQPSSSDHQTILRKMNRKRQQQHRNCCMENQHNHSGGNNQLFSEMMKCTTQTIPSSSSFFSENGEGD